jgi:hypothetical protein
MQLYIGGADHVHTRSRRRAVAARATCEWARSWSKRDDHHASAVLGSTLTDTSPVCGSVGDIDGPVAAAGFGVSVVGAL